MEKLFLLPVQGSGSTEDRIQFLERLLSIVENLDMTSRGERYEILFLAPSAQILSASLRPQTSGETLLASNAIWDSKACLVSST